MAVKMRLEIKNRSHRHDINRPRPRHGHKYIKRKTRLSIMMAIFTKQMLSNIWSSIHKKVTQHRGWAEKKTLLTKKACIKNSF